ncbi:hypothetical protein [Leptolyngbya sp. KIOST-1]|uniref:hypothetical protein n=1 Tax=Leptolyngbya sp. KIOST-1 TaxID=1229172 RepID=UPI00055C664E|nr:hypothetical protein [Leptolyngbya sp. KIOST-1]
MLDDSDSTKTTQRSLLRWGSRFAGGAALGALLVALPLTYGSPLGPDPVQIASVSFVIIGCGLMGMLWGQALINAVLDALGKTGL